MPQALEQAKINFEFQELLAIYQILYGAIFGLIIGVILQFSEDISLLGGSLFLIACSGLVVQYKYDKQVTRMKKFFGVEHEWFFVSKLVEKVIVFVKSHLKIFLMLYIAGYLISFGLLIFLMSFQFFVFLLFVLLAISIAFQISNFYQR